MLSKLFNFLNVKYVSLRNIHRNIYKMDKAYLRHLTDTEKFEISFHYSNPEMRINRQFNFCRQFGETVECFTTRVGTNMSKVINKKNKKKNAENLENVQITLNLNNSEVDKSLLCGAVFQPGNSVILNILDKKYTVMINSPWIDSLDLPNSMLATFPVYPSKFEAIFTDKSASEFIWSKSSDQQNWTEVSRGFIYTPSNSDLNSHIKLACIPKNSEGDEGPLAETISSCKVEASPGECPFERRHKFTKEKLQNDCFRIVTYNILADLYCDMDFTRTELHPYCPAYALNIDYRKQLILKEIVGYNADLICLQELDRKVYKHDLEPILHLLNYQSEFSLKGGQVAEGLGFFYNAKRFKLLANERLVLAEVINKEPQFAEIWAKIADNEPLIKRVMDLATTLQVNVVESLDNTKEVLVVANTHLYFHPDADHIRLLQAGFIMKYIEGYIQTLKDKFSDKRISLVFCGDFNSVPNCGIYKLFTTGQVPEDYIDFRSNLDEAVKNVELKQPFKLQSACGTPKYTNYTALFADCLDYIFYEQNSFKVEQMVPLPTFEEFTQHTAFPSVVAPSDHVALIADLRFCDDK